VHPSGLYDSLGNRFAIEFDEVGCMNLIGVFPGVITFGISLPFDQILQGFVPPPGPVGMYLFYLIFFFPINQIWWWSGKVRSV
jgi:hypothetical protein